MRQCWAWKPFRTGSPIRSRGRADEVSHDRFGCAAATAEICPPACLAYAPGARRAVMGAGLAERVAGLVRTRHLCGAGAVRSVAFAAGNAACRRAGSAGPGLADS